MEKILCPPYESGPNNLRNSEGDIIEYAPGKLLFAYTHFYQDGEDHGAGNIMGKRSEDDGETWSEPFLIKENEASCNSGRLSFIRMRDMVHGISLLPGLLAMVYANINFGIDNELMLITSIDHGRSWSLPRPIRPDGQSIWHCTACRNATVRTLKDGRIILPTYRCSAGLQNSFFIFSDNDGRSWQRSLTDLAVPLTDGDGTEYAWSCFEEPTIAELRDGRLLCFGRTRLGQLFKSYSSDRGLTWTKPVPTGLASSNSPAVLRNIPGTNDLVCVWNHVSGQEIDDHLGRMRLSCAISKDDGETWENFKNLESLDDVGKIEPPVNGFSVDGGSEKDAISRRCRGFSTGTLEHYPEEVSSRYPRWPGYVHNEYPSVTFTSSGKVVFAYNVNDAFLAGLPTGYKIKVEPVSYLYE